MDLYFDNDASSQARAKQRLRTSKRNTSAEYLQVKVNQRPDDSKRQQQWLARKVRGILKTHIIDADEAKTLQSQLEAKEAMQLEPGG